MAEARLEEEEEELRDPREPVVLRNRNPATERNKPEHRLSSQGPLSSIRAAIKRTSRASQGDPLRERRRPAITILSAEPLAPNSWFPGASGGFPPPPPQPQQIWGGSILPDAQPPPSYDQVIKEKTQEQVPPPTATPHCSTSNTIATQTDPLSDSETSVPECTAASQATEKTGSDARRPLKPPRPSPPFEAKPVPSGTTEAAAEPPLSQVKSYTETDTQSPEDKPSPPYYSSESLRDPCPPGTTQSDAQTEPCETCSPSVDTPPAEPTSLHSGAPQTKRPTPRPRTKPSFQPVTREVKVQTLVRLKDNGESTHVIPASGEAPTGKYLQELLDVFSSDPQCSRSDSSDRADQSDQSEESDGEGMEALHSHRNIRAKIQAFEKQASTEPGEKPEPRPRNLQAKPAVVAPKPALAPRLSTRSFRECAAAAGSVVENKHSRYQFPVPATAIKPLPPRKPVEADEEAPSARVPLLPPSLPSVAERAKSFTAWDEGPAADTPSSLAKARGGIDLFNSFNDGNTSLPIPTSTESECLDGITSSVPTKPLRAAFDITNRPSVSRKPTMIRVPSKPAKSYEDETRDPLSILPVQKVMSGPAPPVTRKPSLNYKQYPVHRLPSQESSVSEGFGSSFSEMALPPRPVGGKVLPPRPPPAKVSPGRPPPPATGFRRSTSRAGQGTALPQGTSRKGPVLPPRPKPGHPLYNKYTLEIPHGIAVFDYNGRNSGELSFQKNEVLCLLEQIDNKTFECQVGDIKGRVQKSYMKIITPLSSYSEDPDPGQSQRESSGFQVQALHDFTPEAPGELALRAGDRVSMVEQVDSEWYRGTCKGFSGIFPVSFVKVLSNLPGPPNGKKTWPVAASVSGPRCVARFDFDGEQSDELSFCEGDVIRLKEYVGQEWARGELNHHVGIFPLNFVEIVEDLLAPPTPDSAQKKRPLPGMVSTPMNQAASNTQPGLTGGEWAVALYDFTAQTDEDLSFMQGDRILITEHVDGEWCRGRLRGEEGFLPKAFVETCEDADELQSENHGTGRAKALYEFVSSCDEELSLKVGDVVTGLEVVDEEWFFGELKGKRGLVPKNYVQILQ